MALRRWKVVNLTSGTLELGFRREPLGVGEVVVITSDLPERIRYYDGERKVRVTELPTLESPTNSSTEVSAEPSGDRKSKRNKP